ncbi:uncharacterized protein V6R79_010196 [Siganus canaliculatus]
MGKLLVISLVIAAIAALIGERIVNLRRLALSNKVQRQIHLPNCVPLKNTDFGSEDITFLENGLAFISSGLRFYGFEMHQDVTGKIFVLDINDPKLQPVELRMPSDFDQESFIPHGISAYTDPSDGTVYLFVVNHPQFGSQVEKFRFVEKDFSLVHLKTIKHDLLYSVNDIVAVGVDSFYATNDHYFTSPLMRLVVETLLAQPWCNVVYYSPKEVKIVSQGYYLANGINISPDKGYIYVADMFPRTVNVLERRQDNTLVPVKSLRVDALVDNIEVDPQTGDVWLGCIPNAWKSFEVDTDDPAGSEIYRIQNILSDKPVVTLVYADDGKVVQGSTVAARYGGKLLIGAGFHKGICCDLK